MCYSWNLFKQNIYKKRLDILKIQLFFIIITDINIEYAKCLEEYMQIFSGVIFKKLNFFVGGC